MPENAIGVGVLLFLVSWFLAGAEVEAEGEHGWAENFPTWYRVRGGLVTWAYVKINNKPLTGYHSFMFFVPLLFLALPMVWSGDYSWSNVLWTLASYLAMAVCWDFAWFIINPYYGLGKFRPKNVWWHARDMWLLGRIPFFGYIGAWALALGLGTAAGELDGTWVTGLKAQAAVLGIMLAGWVFLALLFDPIYQSSRKRQMLDSDRQRFYADYYWKQHPREKIGKPWPEYRDAKTGTPPVM
jgi:hypothetical protein